MMSSTPSDTLDALKLPDPAPVAGGADDLLSQMAGDEINRLLADADLEPEQTRKPDAAEQSQPTETVLDSAAESDPSPALSQETISKELDKVFSQQVSGADAPTQNATPSEANTASVTSETSDTTKGAADADISADGVSDLLGRLSAGESIDPPAATPPTTAKGHEAEPVGPQERQALAEPADPATIVVAPPPVTEGKLSRLVDWITRPLDPFPDEIRDVMGKVAIVTAINAIAVLVYVTVFR